MKANTKAVSTGRSTITTRKTINKAGGLAYDLKDKEKLVTEVLTSFINEPKFYGDNTSELISVARRVISEDPEFVARLACYARNEFHMRSVSHVLAAEVAKGAKGNRIVRKMISKIIERVDDITNILAYHLSLGKRQVNPIPRSLRRGIADVFPKFDEYSLSRYKGSKSTVKLKDALLLCRPKPKDQEQADLWKRLIEDRLKTPKTRETILSEKGQSKKVWEEIIDSKAGYMMLLRNLKNMLENNISDIHLDKVCNILKNPEEVRKSKQLPFRFFSAYKMVETLGKTRCTKVLDTIEDALLISFENLPKLSGTTAIITDESGSMDSTISKDSIVQMRQIGNLLASAAVKFCDNSIAVPFGETAKIIHLSTKASIFDNISKLEHSGVGHSTNLHEAFKVLNSLNEPIDRVIIFSDMQCYNDSSYDYRTSDTQRYASQLKTKNKNMWIHSIDLAGHGSIKVIGNNVNLIAGWSDKVLDYISVVEQGENNLVKTIENYDIG